MSPQIIAMIYRSLLSSLKCQMTCDYRSQILLQIRHVICIRVVITAQVIVTISGRVEEICAGIANTWSELRNIWPSIAMIWANIEMIRQIRNHIRQVSALREVTDLQTEAAIDLAVQLTAGNYVSILRPDLIRLYAI